MRHIFQFRGPISSPHWAIRRCGDVKHHSMRSDELNFKGEECDWRRALAKQVSQRAALIRDTP